MDIKFFIMLITFIFGIGGLYMGSRMYNVNKKNAIMSISFGVLYLAISLFIALTKYA